MIVTHIDSPIGELTLAGPSEDVLSRLGFGHLHGDADHVANGFTTARTQLDEYFAGTRTDFDLTLELEGSEWERRVWSELRRIPYGETRSYGQVATAACADRGAGAGAHGARAVGRANHNNPIAIIVPCHRVIGADGKLVGFGGGLDTKRRLLDLEAGRLALV